MRLTDTCQLTRLGQPRGGPRRCAFGHTGGETPMEAGHVNRYIETARVLVEPDPDLAAVANPDGWEVVHKGKTYTVTAILPRYRTHGRLHHVSLDLQVVEG